MRTSLVLCLLSLGHGLAWAEDPAPSLRIATYNLNWGNRYGDEVLDAIAESKAEILFLQESTLQSEQFLQSRLKASHPHFFVAGQDGRYAAERFAFASKFPLRDVVFTPPDKGLFGVFSACCEILGTRVTLINVHLTPFIIQPDDGVAGLMAALKATEVKHTAEIEAICAKLDTKWPTIIAGDFNSLSTFAAPGHLRKRGLIDSFAAVHDDADLHPTWFWPTRPLPLRARIDYIFHTSHFRTASSAVVKREGSDHFLLVSELHIVQPADPPVPSAESHSNAKSWLPKTRKLKDGK
ncbi:MAG: endonuclease/exonuclease/phosphatase family protein [Pirellulaceae bacterium]